MLGAHRETNVSLVGKRHREGAHTFEAQKFEGITIMMLLIHNFPPRFSAIELSHPQVYRLAQAIRACSCSVTPWPSAPGCILGENFEPRPLFPIDGTPRDAACVDGVSHYYGDKTTTQPPESVPLGNILYRGMPRQGCAFWFWGPFFS